jgi:hypothetical protein
LIREVVKNGGKLPFRVVLQCRIRYFTDGVILGSKEFVAKKSAGFGGKKGYEPQALVPITDWEDLYVLSRMRRNLWG